MHKTDKSPLLSGRAKLLVAALAATLLIIGGTATSRALDMGHFVQCFGWMIFDPDQHAAQCLPSNIPPENKPLTTPGTPSPPSDDILDTSTTITLTLTDDDDGSDECVTC